MKVLHGLGQGKKAAAERRRRQKLQITVLANLGLPDRLMREMISASLAHEHWAVRCKGAELAALVFARASEALQRALEDDQAAQEQVLARWTDRLPRAGVLRKFWALQLAATLGAGADAGLVRRSLAHFAQVVDFLLPRYPGRYGEIDPGAMLAQVAEAGVGDSGVEISLLKSVLQGAPVAAVGQEQIAAVIRFLAGKRETDGGDGRHHELLLTLKRFLQRRGLLAHGKHANAWELEAWLYSLYGEDVESEKIADLLAAAIDAGASEEKLAEVDSLREEHKITLESNSGEPFTAKVSRVTALFLTDQRLRKSKEGKEFLRRSLPVVLAVQDFPSCLSGLISSERRLAGVSLKGAGEAGVTAGEVATSLLGQSPGGRQTWEKPFCDGNGGMVPLVEGDSGDDDFADFLRASQLLTNLKVASGLGRAEGRDCPESRSLLVNLAEKAARSKNQFLPSVLSGDYFRTYLRPLTSDFEELVRLVADTVQHLDREAAAALAQAFVRDAERLAVGGEKQLKLNGGARLMLEKLNLEGKDLLLLMRVFLDVLDWTAEKKVVDETCFEVTVQLLSFSLERTVRGCGSSLSNVTSMKDLGPRLSGASETVAGSGSPNGPPFFKALGDFLRHFDGFISGVNVDVGVVPSLCRMGGDCESMLCYLADSSELHARRVIEHCKSAPDGRAATPWLRPLHRALCKVARLDESETEAIVSNFRLHVTSFFTAASDQTAFDIMKLLREKYSVGMDEIVQDDLDCPTSETVSPGTLAPWCWIIGATASKKKRKTLAKELLNISFKKVLTMWKERRKAPREVKVAMREVERFLLRLKDVAKLLRPALVRDILGETVDVEAGESPQRVWFPMACSMLKYALKTGEDHPCRAASLGVLDHFCASMYLVGGGKVGSDKVGGLGDEEKEEVKLLASMILGHSGFLPTLLDPANPHSDVKAALLGLLVTLSRASPEWLRREMIPTMLGKSFVCCVVHTCSVLNVVPNHQRWQAK